MDGERTPHVIQLPGLGYFHQSPTGLHNLSIGARIALQSKGSLLSVPASGTAGTSAGPALFTGLSMSDGIFLEDCWGLIIPGDNSGQLTIASGQLQIFGSGPGDPYQLGFFAATQLSPRGPIVAVRDSQKLITMRDLQLLNNFAPPTDTPFINFFCQFHNNDAGAAHTVTLEVGVVFRVLKGILE